MSVSPAIRATQLGFVRGTDLSSWNEAGAYQGQYTGSAPRVGVMLFGDLHSINWREQSISKIDMQLTFSGAGRSAEKTISMYRGTKSTINGTGQSMIGDRIGDFRTNGTAYNSTRTITFSESVNSNVFIQLVAWLRSMTTNTLVIYRNETTTSSYTENYLQITAASLTVTYELAGSSGTLDKESADAGRPVTLTITPMQSDRIVTHAVEWIFGSHSSGVQNLAAGLTASFSAPLDWLDQIPSALKGTAYCRLYTYLDGEELSAQDIPYTITVPAAIFPSIGASVTPVGTEGGYWQHIGAARVEIVNAEGRYGATIASMSITGPDGVNSDQSAVVTPNFAGSGLYRYTLIVTDSRGKSARLTPSITVNALSPPAIDAFSVARYAAKINDAGETVYAENLSGGHVWFTIDADIDPAGGNNTPTAYILYGPAGSANRKRVDIPWPENASGIITANDAGILTTDIPLNSAYEFQLVIADKFSSAAWTARVEKSSAIMHFSGNGYGVSIGGFSGGTIDDKRFDVSAEWTSHFPGGAYGYGDHRIDRAETSMDLPITNDAFAPYSDGLAPRISRVGPVVWLEGMLRNTADLAKDFEEIVAVLPEWAQPRTDAFALHQGSGQCIFWLRAYTNGNLMICRYRDGDGTVAAAAGKQFPLTLSWLAADAFIRTYSLDYTLTACTLSNVQPTVMEGRAYAAKVVPQDGYIIAYVFITMGGTDVSAFYDPQRRMIHIPAASGDISISAAAAPASAIIVVDDDGDAVITSGIIDNNASGDAVLGGIGLTVDADGDGSIG